jgi:hypothetical protein
MRLSVALLSAWFLWTCTLPVVAESPPSRESAIRSALELRETCANVRRTRAALAQALGTSDPEDPAVEQLCLEAEEFLRKEGMGLPMPSAFKSFEVPIGNASSFSGPSAPVLQRIYDGRFDLLTDPPY